MGDHIIGGWMKEHRLIAFMTLIERIRKKKGDFRGTSNDENVSRQVGRNYMIEPDGTGKRI